MNNRGWLEANICYMKMSVLPNSITRHYPTPLLDMISADQLQVECMTIDPCPYLSYLDTCLAGPLFSITDLESSRPQYPHLHSISKGLWLLTSRYRKFSIFFHNFGKSQLPAPVTDARVGVCDI